MNIGQLLILLAFAGLIISTFSFFLAARGRRRFASLARKSYGYFTTVVVLASLLLFYLFLSGDYSYRYVFEYSSSELSLFILISAFWAGQQGTYLLWLLLSAVLGYYILKRGGEYTDHAMVFYGLINVFFCVMLMALSPFEKLPFAQPDGAGLNPLLNDPWMVVHPPVIFLGYAAVAIPCAFALAAMVRREYTGLVQRVFPAAALGAVALAAGNIMGGFWAYKTLGWGGYWAWDPVENSSFIPWMTAVALIHGLLIERRNGTLRRTNLFMSLFTFLLVVYGTFLTRSGVLADFSVHSFVDLGVNKFLIGFMVLFAVLALAIFAVRFRGIKGPAINMAASSREFALLISVWVLVLIGLLVLSGTSWPLITTLFGNPGTVDTIVYSRLTFPLTIVIGLFLGLSPFMLWPGGAWGELLKKIIPSVIGAALAVVAAYVAGVTTVSYLLYVFAAALALLSNIIVLWGRGNFRFWGIGANVAHLGFALMLIGILGSSAYSSNQKAKIDRYGTGEVFGREVTYRGMAGEITSPDNEILLDVVYGGENHEIRPKLYWSARMEGLMKKPYIQRYPLYDLYFAPEQILDLSQDDGLRLARGDTVRVGGYSITFVGFSEQPHSSGGPMSFGAVLQVTDSTGASEETVPSILFEAGQGMQPQPAPLMKGLDQYPVSLERIFADDGAILLKIGGLIPEAPTDRLILEVSKKPTMNMLWGGSIILLIGGLISLGNRWRQSVLLE